MYVCMCIKHTMKSEFTRIHMVPCVQNSQLQLLQYDLEQRNRRTYSTRDEFELEFSGSSKPELWKFRADPSQAGAL